MPLWGATPDMVCICGEGLGHVGWRGCFGKAHNLVCSACEMGDHLSCTSSPCPCVHVQTKPAKRLRVVDDPAPQPA